MITALERLNNLVGLDNIKEEILKSVELKECPNFVFLGNHGTGKTTLAYIIAELFKDNGILSNGHVVHIKGTDLVGEYEAQTIIKTRQCVEKALGGVLFIDEAYSLNNGPSGIVALNQLRAMLDKHKNDFVCILAGCKFKMVCFLVNHPTIMIRFVEFQFDDYTLDEMVMIFKALAKSEKAVLDDGLEDAIRKIFSVEMEKANDDWGNARSANVILQEMLRLWRNNEEYTVDDADNEYKLLRVFDIPRNLKAYL